MTAVAVAATEPATVHTNGNYAVVADFVVAPPQPVQNWDLRDFEVLHKLGGGNYGQVFLAAVRNCNFLVALKKVPISQLANDGIVMQLRREVEIAFNTRHRHLLRTYGYFFDDKDVFLILEPCARGMLYTELLAVKKFPTHIAAKYVAQLSEALLYLHQHHVIHRDIKPENILIDHNGDLKLADFGWSVHDPRNRRQTSCGTPEYFPPEVVMRRAYDHTADLWCVGVFCYELLFGSTPFVHKDKKQIFVKIQAGDFTMPPELPADAQDLISQLLKPDGQARMSLLQVVQHPFLQNNYYRPCGVTAPTGRPPRNSGEKRPRGD